MAAHKTSLNYNSKWRKEPSEDRSAPSGTTQTQSPAKHWNLQPSSHPQGSATTRIHLISLPKPFLRTKVSANIPRKQLLSQFSSSQNTKLNHLSSGERGGELRASPQLQGQTPEQASGGFSYPSVPAGCTEAGMDP